MAIALVQGIKTMIFGVLIVHRPTKVPGGISTATLRTSMACTATEHTYLMVWFGVLGGTLSNLLR